MARHRDRAPGQGRLLQPHEPQDLRRPRPLRRGRRPAAPLTHPAPLAVDRVPDDVPAAPDGLAAQGEPEPLHHRPRADVAGRRERVEPRLVGKVLAPALERGSAALGGEAAPPPVAVEHPADLRRIVRLERPVVVAEDADPADQAAALEVLGGPLPVPVVLPHA